MMNVWKEKSTFDPRQVFNSFSRAAHGPGKQHKNNTDYFKKKAGLSNSEAGYRRIAGKMYFFATMVV
jgi:hypothetical protein